MAACALFAAIGMVRGFRWLPLLKTVISLAVAVTTRCDGCIVFHTDAALKAGASKEEISEALGVAVAMNAGAALIYSTRVLDAVEAKSAAAHP